MVKKQITFSLSLMFSIVMLSALSLAVVNTIYWQGGGDTLSIDRDETATFDVSVNSFEPGAGYSIDLYNSEGKLINNLKSGTTPGDATGGGFYTESVTITPADRNNLGGLMYVTVTSNEGSGLTYDEDSKYITLDVANFAPNVGNLPNVEVEQDVSTNVFDLDEYVTDADDDESTLIWAVTGNDNITVEINSNNEVTLTPDTGFLGQNTLVFTATDTSGDSDSDTVLVEVVPTGTSKGSKKVTIQSLNIESFGDDLLKVRNTGSVIEDVRLSLNLEAMGMTEQLFKFDLERNMVTYLALDLEDLEVGEYLARIKLTSSDNDDFEESGYLLIEKF